jgi:2-succinyl-5-enolpyruvyl-6-hydroxy-3-cyclohexene-1-carboxylate synthase
VQYPFAGNPTIIPLIHQHIYNIAEICARKGLHQVVLSPGSRCAPLTVAFARHPEMTVRTISDERAAAFIGLGISLKSGQPSVLICTSGSAAYNYAPAIAEAWYQQVPLLVLTADRPPEWIDQMDGQTIRQRQIYGDHVKGSFELPVDTHHPDAAWHMNRQVNEAINLARAYPAGPVHLNIPLREPLYPKEEGTLFYEDARIIEEKNPLRGLYENDWSEIKKEWRQYDRKLLMGGQGPKSDALTKALSLLSGHQHIPVLGDIISNLHEVESIISHGDLLLTGTDDSLKNHLRPDLLLTFGKSVLSKQVKLFLRKYKPTAHWHIQPEGEVADTYQSLTRIIRCHPEDLIKALSKLPEEEGFSNQRQQNYGKVWQIEEGKAQRHIAAFFKEKSFSEPEAYYRILQALPENIDLHLANSMAVRYADYFGLEQKSIEIFANRGTSGIDGSSSTAVGTALYSGKPTYLLTGDVAFFYDRNAYWHNYPLPNLRIVLFNNHGGGIFRMIDGPGDQPELEEYFETRQLLTGKHLAEEFGMEYICCDHPRKFTNSLKAFFDDSILTSGPRLLEIVTDGPQNKIVLDSFKKK